MVTQKVNAKRNRKGSKLSARAKELVLLSELANGTSFNNIVKKYTEEWGLAPVTIRGLLTIALEHMYDKEFKDHLKEINLHRLDSIIDESFEEGDYKTAIKAIDIQNKTMALYKERIELQDGIEFTLNF
jgi:hypothetical protein